MLGAGGMGAVCLAHQISLDRDVALKILPSYMAENPDFLMRFTREALSAAQLTHHNIIQIYDIGSDQGIHYISMEFVRGETLGEITRRQGKLASAVAAGYILQAARGLHYAHERGIIHRDIKPDNLMLNDQGILKIADMGLAKMRGEVRKPGERPGPDAASLLQKARGDLTMSEVAMGTPAYMPPEQARDASTVDHRADQYSLGCTLYFLIAGTTPYTGNTAYELINKHMMDPLPPLENHAPETPKDLTAVINRMMEKEPEARYPSMAEVIHDLEGLLGVEGMQGAQGPREVHRKLLHEAQQAFYRVKGLKRRKVAILGFYLGMALLIVAVFTLQTPPDVEKQTWLDRLLEVDWAKGMVGIMLLSPIASFVLHGVLNKTYLFRRVRNVFTSLSARGWWSLAVSIVLLVFVFGASIIIAILGSALAAVAYELGIRRPLWAERREPLRQVQTMLKELRGHGLSEEALQDFVCNYCGEDWEEFFEGLFGYEALIAARARLSEAEKSGARKQYAVWRDPLARWLEKIEKGRKEKREKRQLADVEAERLKAKGASESEARKQADAMASMIARQGFLQTADAAPIPVSSPSIAVSKAAAPPNPEKKWKPVRPLRTQPIFELDQGIRLGFGLAVCVLYGVTQFIGFDMVPAALKLEHYGDVLGLGAGIILILSAFSSRSSMGSLIVAGTILMIANHPISAMINRPPLSDPQYVMGVGVILIGAGIGFPILSRLSGQKF